MYRRFANDAPARVRLALALSGLVSMTAGVVPSAAHAEDADGAPCDTISHTEAVHILVCPSDSTDAQWRAAGRAACDDGSRCNAWIWLDAAAAPARAPTTDAELPKDRTALAAAVWIADAQSLVLVRAAP